MLSTFLKSTASIRSATRIQVALFMLTLLIVGILGGWTVSLTRIEGPVYKEIETGKALVSDVLPPPLYIVEPYLTANRLVLAKGKVRGQLASRLRSELADYRQKLEEWKRIPLAADVSHELLEVSAPPALRFADLADDLIRAVEAGQQGVATGILVEMESNFLRHRASIEHVVDLASKQTATMEREAERTLTIRMVAIACIALSIFTFSILVNLRIGRQIECRVKEAVRVSEQVASGDLTSPGDTGTGDDEVSEILRSLEKMRQAIAKHVADLQRQQAELAVAKEQAEASDRLKSEFLANMSHELRTPLNGVSGMLYVLSEGALTEEQRRHLALATDSADTLTTLIDDMLFLAALRGGRTREAAEPFVLQDLLTRVQFRHRKKAMAKHLDLELDVREGAPLQIVAPLKYLDRALSALVDNAIKFTPAGGVRMVAETALRDGRRVCVLRVSDTGPGIAEDQRQELFRGLVQQDGSTTRNHGGVGVGLSLVKAIAEAVGGRISYSPAEEGGACFSLEVPVEPYDGSMAPEA